MIQQDDRSRRVEGRDKPGDSFETACRFGEHQRHVLLSLDHRLRNNLSALLTLVDLTKREVRSVDEFAEAISAKIRVMAATYSLYSRSNFRSVDLRELISAIPRAAFENEIEILGADVEVPMRQAFAVGMVLNTLLAHAAGTFARQASSVRIHMDVEHPDERSQLLDLEVNQEGGNPVPLTPGDQQLLTGLIKFELRGTFDIEYGELGARYHIRAQLDGIEPG